MKEFVIKKGKEINGNQLLISAVIILLLVIAKNENLYLIMFIPILLCTFSILIDLIMLFRWLKSLAIVVTSNHVLFNHNILYRNRKIDMEHLAVNREKGTLLITNFANLSKREQKIFFKNENKFIISLESLLEKDKQDLLQLIESKLI